MSKPENRPAMEEDDPTKRSRAFFQEAFAQVREHPLRAKRFPGKFASNYKELWEKSEDQLRDIDPSLSIDALQEVPSMTHEQYQTLLTPLTHIQMNKLSKIRKEYHQAINDLVNKRIIPALFPQNLPSGVLETPSIYYQQEGRRTCFPANYEMILTAITGEPVRETDLLNAARSNDLTIENRPKGILSNVPLSDIQEDTLLTTLQTPAFKKAFPDIQVGVLKLVGADFEDIIDLTKKLRSNASKKGLSLEAYCLPAYQSEVFQYGWHNAVLLSADEDRVMVHDPSNGKYDTGFRKGEPVGGANKRFYKERFIWSWGKAHLRSDYIFALKPPEGATK